jgi:hypothetical protein
MARPTKRKDGVTRNHGHTVMLASDELEQLRTAAATVGTSVGDFLRAQGLSASVQILDHPPTREAGT